MYTAILYLVVQENDEHFEQNLVDNIVVVIDELHLCFF